LTNHCVCCKLFLIELSNTVKQDWETSPKYKRHPNHNWDIIMTVATATKTKAIANQEQQAQLLTEAKKAAEAQAAKVEIQSLSAQYNEIIAPTRQALKQAASNVREAKSWTKKLTTLPALTAAKSWANGLSKKKVEEAKPAATLKLNHAQAAFDAEKAQVKPVADLAIKAAESALEVADEAHTHALTLAAPQLTPILSKISVLMNKAAVANALNATSIKFAHSFMYSANDADCEEVANESLLKLYQVVEAGAYEGKCTVDTHLYTIIKSRGLNKVHATNAQKRGVAKIVSPDTNEDDETDDVADKESNDAMDLVESDAAEPVLVDDVVVQEFDYRDPSKNIIFSAINQAHPSFDDESAEDAIDRLAYKASAMEGSEMGIDSMLIGLKEDLLTNVPFALAQEYLAYKDETAAIILREYKANKLNAAATVKSFYKLTGIELGDSTMKERIRDKKATSIQSTLFRDTIRIRAFMETKRRNGTSVEDLRKSTLNDVLPLLVELDRQDKLNARMKLAA